MSIGMQSNYKVLKILKKIDNRLCADCRSPLGEASNCYASLTFHVWLCSECAQVHQSYLDKVDSKLKNFQDEWNETEIQLMDSAKSNNEVNKVLEKYIPKDWKIINVKSSFGERKTWIRAKYYSMYFALPHHNIVSSKRESLDGSNSSVREIKIVMDKSLPTRAVDYFMTIGLGKSVVKSHDATKCPQSLDMLQFHPHISNCFPPASQYQDTPIPDLIGPIVFPDGLCLSTSEKAPFCFSFVMTNINRVKLFGTALIVYELVDPEQLKGLLSPGDLSALLVGSSAESSNKASGKTNGHSRASSHQVFYAPKALTVISHYGFFHLFGKFLEQIYHVSLSASPIPIERFISNFVLELPLPPQGRTEIFFSLPESMLQISRPPRNYLPMVDFSFRPLFVSLSVENILSIFACLCAEMTVCICASNIALLTPVQEALLALLFPFVWQGCYVPVLPKHMMELLDAPVPLLVGVHDSYLHQTPENKRPQTVVFVHLDTDTVYFGHGDDFFGARTIPQLPKQAAAKLKKKLVEHGECIYREASEMQRLKLAGQPFPNNEHLVPINGFISEQGVITQVQRSFSSNSVLSSQVKLGIKRVPGTIHEDSGLRYRHPAACSLEMSSSSRSILDPANNCNDGDGFDAKEIREAFLRFFVASFVDYDDHFYKVDPSNSGGGVGVNGNNAAASAKGATPENRKKSIFKRRDTFQSKLSGSDVVRFNKDAYVEKLTEPFLKQMVETQMFSNYVSERIECPEQAEIRFFDENILAKANRSKFSLLKSSTPFLSDETDNISESYSVPGPSNASIPDDKVFSYSQFPTLNEKLVGVVRVPKVLVSEPEIKRLQGQSALLIREQLLNRDRDANSPVYLIDNPRASSDDVTSLAAGAEEDAETALNAVLLAAHNRYVKVLEAVVAVQSFCRMRPVQRRFRLMLSSVCHIERFVRMTSLRRTIQRRLLGKYAVRIQKSWRRVAAKRKFRQCLRVISWVQNWFRGSRFRKAFRLTLSRVIVVQALYRRHRALKRQCANLSSLFTAYRSQALSLWDLEGTSLYFRSQFWVQLNVPSLLNTALYQEELCRLYDALRMYSHDSPFFALKAKTLRFAIKFEAVQKSGFVQKLLERGGAARSELTAPLARSTSTTGRELGAHLSACSARVQEERHSLYVALKAQDSHPALKDSLFRQFGLQEPKKRKQRLCDSVWTGSAAEHVAASSQIVIKLSGLLGAESSPVNWAQQRRSERMARNCVGTVQACLVSMQHSDSAARRKKLQSRVGKTTNKAK